MSEEKYPREGRRITSEVLVTKYVIDYNTPMEDPSQFNEDYLILRNASPDDLIELRINSVGGSVSTLIQLINNVKNCSATVHGILEGDALSAHSLLFLACDSFSVCDNATMMIHNGAEGFSDSHDKLHKYMEHSKKHTKRLCEEGYKGFLSPKEIKKMLSGKDIWLDKEQILKRLARKVELMQEELESEAEDS